MEKLVGRYSFAEEILNAATHGLGILLSIVGLSVLVAYASLDGSPLLITSCAIFGGSLILSYSFSTLYHAIFHERAKQIFRQFDHAAIYLLIAGTYTPITLIMLPKTLGWTIFTIIWTVSIVGIILKFVYPRRFKKTSMVLYLILGWFIIIVINKLFEAMPSGGLWLLLLGGIFYTVGVIFYLYKKLPYNHAIWHLFVLVGSSAHYFMVLFYIIP